MYPRQGHRSPRRCNSWEPEHRDCRAIPGQGLQLTAGRGTRDVREETAVENACGGKPGSHGNHESHVGGGAITIASLFIWQLNLMGEAGCTPLSTWYCQNPCNPSSCTTSTPTPHWGRRKSSRTVPRANPSGRPTCTGGNKTITETQGQFG